MYGICRSVRSAIDCDCTCPILMIPSSSSLVARPTDRPPSDECTHAPFSHSFLYQEYPLDPDSRNVQCTQTNEESRHGKIVTETSRSLYVDRGPGFSVGFSFPHCSDRCGYRRAFSSLFFLPTQDMKTNIWGIS